MAEKRAYKLYPEEFKEEAAAIVREQGYSVAQAAEAVGVTTTVLYKWKEKLEAQLDGTGLSDDERDELKRLRKEVKQLRMEKESPISPAATGSWHEGEYGRCRCLL